MRVKFTVACLTAYSFLLFCSALYTPAYGVIVQPSNVVLPGSPGGTFSFDLVVNDATGTSAQAFQATISSSGPGSLTLNTSASQAVASVSDYWVFGNSAGATAIDLGGSSYQFGDGPDNGIAQLLTAGDIMARYAFTWGGTPGDYNFTLNLNPASSFILNGAFQTEALQFNSGQYPGDADSFTITMVPEPATMLLLGLGSLTLLRKRRT